MKIAIYARVSTTRQAENDLSIPDQLRQIREWAKANSHIVVMEYVEPGATATDDKRPQFQRLIQDALQKPAPYDSIVVHSLSRFFRDPIQMGFYERKLKKNKVKLISITQQTSDDSQGEMMRLIISTLTNTNLRRMGSIHQGQLKRMPGKVIITVQNHHLAIKLCSQICKVVMVVKRKSWLLMN